MILSVIKLVVFSLLPFAVSYLFEMVRDYSSRNFQVGMIEPLVFVTVVVTTLLFVLLKTEWYIDLAAGITQVVYIVLMYTLVVPTGSAESFYYPFATAGVFLTVAVINAVKKFRRGPEE